MIGYSEKEIFSKPELQLFSRARRFVDDLVEFPTEVFRCHELARAVAASLRELGFLVDVVDGHIGAVDHSWLVTQHKHILDVYAVGRLPMVQLVDPFTSACMGYREGRQREDIDQAVVEKIVERVRVVSLVTGRYLRGFRGF